MAFLAAFSPPMLLLLLLFTFLTLGPTWALPKNRTDALTGAAIDAGKFQTPSANVRPRFRYWLPDANVNLTNLVDDIKQAKVAGAGGVEFLPYYLYGQFLTPGYQPDDWDIYGFGTPAFAEVFRAAAQAHKDNELIMDFATGPNQGQGVPAPADSDGIAWDLFLNDATIQPGGSFHGKIPGWGSGTLISLTSGAVVAEKNYTINGTNPLTGQQLEYHHTNYTLAFSSLEDHTTEVNSAGMTRLNFPPNSSVLSYKLLATYRRRSYWKASQAGPNPQDFIQNGSFAVDHFSSAGAKTTTDFFEKYILINGTRELLQEIGNYAWEDSIEIYNNLYWTPEFPTAFQQNRGYSASKFIPLFFNNDPSLYSTFFQPGGPLQMFWTDEADSGQSHIDDYRTTLGELYATFLEGMKTWTNEYLDMQYSAQVAYNLPMDVLARVPDVDAPELESLGFGDNIDGYRQYVGPANLAQKRIISSELGAHSAQVYQLWMPELLWDVKRSLAAGVNQFVFHGYPYSWQYPNTTWPGFTTFGYLFAEMHSRHQPAWEYYSDYVDFVARNQYVLQQGSPKVDVVFYLKETYSNVNWPTIYIPTDLKDSGYSYEYLSPDNLNLPQATIENGRLGYDGPAYKAIIIQGNDSMTTLGVQKLSQFAHAGFPIIFQGGIPSGIVGYNASLQTYTNFALQQLTSLPNVHQISAQNSVARTLASIGIYPATKIYSKGSLYTYWRRDDISKADYVYIYSDLTPSNGTIAFNSTGTPYKFDAWTGQISPILNYTVSGGRTSIYFELAGNQSTIVAFTDEPIPGIALPKNICVSQQELLLKHGTVYAKLPHNISELSNWNLTIKEWGPPEDLFDINPVAIFSNHTFQLSKLVPWNHLPGMTNVSGIGYYSTTFQNTKGTGAIIDFGAILHTIRVRVNGELLPQLDVTHSRTDISAYLCSTGQNSLEVEVATPLYNQLRPIWTELLSSGASSTLPVGPSADYGLLAPVRVTTYTAKRVTC